MQVIAYSRYGSVEQLQSLVLPEPKMKPNQVLVSVHSMGLNPLDYRIRNGEMGPLIRFKGPRLIGSDFAGHVSAVGAKVRSFRPGDRVFGMVFQLRTGTSAERIVVDHDQLAHSPKTLNDSEAATVPLAAQTAYQALHHLAKIQSGQRVLINGASGGVGTFAVQLARIAGAHVTAVTSHRNTHWMAELGANETMDYTAEDCCQGSARYDLFFDCYGNRSFTKARSVLSPNGMYITTIPSPRSYGWSLANPFRRQQSRVVLVRNRVANLVSIGQLIDAQKLRTIVDTVYPLREIQTAYAALETKRTRGKIAVRFDTETTEQR
jgi:NADPH:quinone reductase-like Zn-dependent oxidoreductase